MGHAIRRLLIANRGEIAVRVIRACRELSIGCAVVHEPAERSALHVELADLAAEVDSYLNGTAIVAAAEALAADAVHPGYGYLAENPEFADLVANAGLVWVGPPATAMRAAGDKLSARRLAEAAGVAVVAGYGGVDLTDATLTAEAERVGYPLLVKAAAGGGGRGMRAVESEDDLAAAIAAARREAQAAFGDDRVYLEHVVSGARHVEVQILADSGGRVIHLGERDCSAQRRHQKIVEESPSPAVGSELRRELGEAAVAIARAAGYVGAGTAEFLVGSDGDWWFLELNARLQVEHPVTEAVCGIDLVRAQLELAAGRPLELEQSDVALRGHAVECRLYAEDPARGFLPATGRLDRFELPHWPGLRVDTGLRPGDEVDIRYDPLLAKLVAHAEDRDACLERLAAALADSVVLGVRTNLGFLRWLVDTPAFRSGELDTGFVERAWSPSLVPALPDDVRSAALASRVTPGPWREYGSAAAHGPVVPCAGRFVLHDGWQFEIGDDDSATVATAAGPGSLEAPMPGTVLRVDVTPGDAVTAGQQLVLLEAMKMELAVSAPADGVITGVHVHPGDRVSTGVRLVDLEPA